MVDLPAPDAPRSTSVRSGAARASTSSTPWPVGADSGSTATPGRDALGERHRGGPLGLDVGLGQHDDRLDAAVPGHRREALQAAGVHGPVEPVDDQREVDVGREHLARDVGAGRPPDELRPAGKELEAGGRLVPDPVADGEREHGGDAQRAVVAEDRDVAAIDAGHAELRCGQGRSPDRRAGPAPRWRLPRGRGVEGKLEMAHLRGGRAEVLGHRCIPPFERRRRWSAWMLQAGSRRCRPRSGTRAWRCRRCRAGRTASCRTRPAAPRLVADEEPDQLRDPRVLRHEFASAPVFTKRAWPSRDAP